MNEDYRWNYWWVWLLAGFLIWIFFFNGPKETDESQINYRQQQNDFTNENIESDQIGEDVNVDSDPPVFNGYPCTDDCSGHEAGYEWAEENGITQDDVDNYSGNSNSFMEGMQSFVDDNE